MERNEVNRSAHSTWGCQLSRRVRTEILQEGDIRTFKGGYQANTAKNCAKKRKYNCYWPEGRALAAQPIAPAPFPEKSSAAIAGNSTAPRCGTQPANTAREQSQTAYVKQYDSLAERYEVLQARHDALWNATVERVTVYADERFVFWFWNGAEVGVEM